jgi:hypothetical protein
VKTFVIDRSSAATEELFKKICKERKSKPITSARLTKSKLLAYLSRRYKGPVAKIIAQFFDFSTNYEYDSFLDEMENFMNYKKDTLKKMAFSIYDFDQDQNICSLDLYTFFKNYEHDDDCFFKALSRDLNIMENEITGRREKMGLANSEVTFKLKDIDEKL